MKNIGAMLTLMATPVCKLADQLQHGAMGLGFGTLPGVGRDGLILRGDVSVLQFEGVDNELAFGMFSPAVEVGFALSGVSLVVAADYVLRFSTIPNEGFLAVKLGYTFESIGTR